jgi:fructosamine-3-kinase
VGRSIKPALLHGDLWDGNIAVILDGEKEEKGKPVIFDAGAV